MAGIIRANNGNYRKGDAKVMIIVVIVVIVLVALLNFISIERLPKAENPASSDEMFPWEHSDSLVAQDQIVNMEVYDEMISVENGFELILTVEDTQWPAQMTVLVDSDGFVGGAWSTDYNKEHMNYNINADFQGNIDPSVIYFDQNGEDFSKLFFIAKGQALILAINKKNDGVANSVNDVYVAGWITPDGKATGQLGVLLAEENHKIYKWRSATQASKKPLLQL